MSDWLSSLGGLAPMGFVALGFALGMRHATDPDHVIAVTAILTRERRLLAATRTGLLWGLGHSLTVLLVGCAIILLKIRIPVRLGLAMEFGVAVVLIMLGLPAAAAMVRQLGLRWQRRGRDLPRAVEVHSHLHSHGEGSHRHPHAHNPSVAPIHHEHTFSNDSLAPAGRSAVKSFGVGLVHGLAGSAAIALFVLGAIPDPLWATIYLEVFCIGTIAGMMLITTAIGAPMVLAAHRVAKLHRGLALGSGLLSLAFGLFIAYQIGVVDGLFSSVPIWTPR